MPVCFNCNRNIFTVVRHIISAANEAGLGKNVQRVLLHSLDIAKLLYSRIMYAIPFNSSVNCYISAHSLIIML